MTEKRFECLKSLSVQEIRRLSKTDAQWDHVFLQALSVDSRAGVREIYRKLCRQRERRQEGLERLNKLFQPERQLWDRCLENVAGVDEAGRGPLAGPVVAAAVVFPGFTELPGLNDSKKLSSGARNELAVLIKEVSVDWALGLSTVSEVLCYNIYWASLLAMKRALAGLKTRPDHVLVDGFPIKGLEIPQQALVGGDGICASIAAASILAKVSRDEIMRILHLMYPRYGFINHKGYPTREHIQALEIHGPCPFHRTGFGPVKKVLPDRRGGQS